MFTASGAILPSVLIVQNSSGNVFIVENNKSKPQIEKILKKDLQIEPKKVRPPIPVPRKSKSREPSPDYAITEIKTEPKEENDDYDEYQDADPSQIPFIDPDTPFNIKLEPAVKVEELEAEKVEEPAETENPEKVDKVHQKTFDGRWSESSEDEGDFDYELNPVPKYTKPLPEPTFDGKWSSDEDGGLEDDESFGGDASSVEDGGGFDDGGFQKDNSNDSDDEPLINVKKKLLVTKPVRKEKKKKKKDVKVVEKKWKHKARSLVGKIVCKYCMTFFPAREELLLHVCKYLDCDKRNFICRICNKELSKKTHSTHLHEACNCQYCGKKFVNTGSLKNHIKTQHKDEAFISPLSLLPIPEPVKVDPPVVPRPKKKYIRKKTIFECDFCGKYLMTLFSLSCHMSMHTGNASYICENCGEKFCTPNGIKQHKCQKKRRFYDKEFRIKNQRCCRFCEVAFATYTENKSHACKYQHPDDPNKVFCRVCGKVYPKFAFNTHFAVHRGEVFNCSVCNKPFTTKRGLRRHTRVHSSEKHFTCKICEEGFSSRHILENHMMTDHGAAKKIYRCEYCFKELSTSQTLRAHIRKMHETIEQCELCKMQFSSQDELKYHLQTTHKPSVCNVCNKSFALPRYLKLHEKMHFEDPTPHVQCHICLRKYQTVSMKTHMFKKHPNEFKDWEETFLTL